MEQLRTIKFPGYSNYICVNDAYQDFVTKFLSVIDFVVLIGTLIVKYTAKLSLDIDILNAIRKNDKHCKKFKRSGKEIDKDNFKCAKLLLKRAFKNKKKLYFEEKIAKNKNNPK